MSRLTTVEVSVSTPLRLAENGGVGGLLLNVPSSTRAPLLVHLSRSKLFIGNESWNKIVPLGGPTGVADVLLNSTVTRPASMMLLATTISSLPSPLRSPNFTDRGP